MHAAVTVWNVAAIGLFAYLLGGVPVGWLLVRMTHGDVDLRDLGTGNVGTSNIYRNVDAGLAAVVGPAQFAQGLIPVLVARWFGFPTSVLVLVALCAVIGNGWPIWLGFNGGRGIAVATGAVAGLDPVGLAGLLACYAVGALARQIALGVLLGFVLLPVVLAVHAGATLGWGAVGLLVLVLLRRLEGVRADLDRYGLRCDILVRRLALDQRPGRPLVGRRSDG